MAVIDLRDFGGILPSVDPRRLPAGAAQTAHNLDLRFGDFRPRKGNGASVATVADGTRTIFRTPSGVWLSSTKDVNYVNGQINDADSERVYLTGRDLFPEAWEAGVYRRLGVPAPTAAPTVELLEEGEFSTDDLTAFGKQVLSAVRTAFEAQLTTSNVGETPTPTPPNATTAGWLQHGAVAGLPTSSSIQWAYCVPLILSNGAYVAVNTNEQFLLSSALAGVRVTFSGSEYWAVPFHVQGSAFVLNQTAFETALGAILNPVTDEPLWDAATIDEIGNKAGTAMSQATEPAAGLIANLNSAQNDLTAALSASGITPEVKAQVIDFFLRADVQAQMTSVIGTSTGNKALTNNPDSGTYPPLVAGPGFMLGTTKVDGTSSNVSNTRYFHFESDAETAVNIRADFTASIYTDSRGVPTVNYEALAKKIRDELNNINNQRPVNERYPLETIEWAVTNALVPVRAVYSDTNWATYPEWPLATVDEAGRLAAVTSAKTETKAASDAVGAHFVSAKTGVLDYIKDELLSEYVLPAAPDATIRIIETRSYIATYVTDWGEESAPSAPSELVTLDQNDAVRVTVVAPPAARYIRKIRLYRSSSSNTGAAFQFVTENDVEVQDASWGNVANRRFDDARLQEELQEVCPSLTWAEPPEDLIGLIGLPNGIMAGFFGKTLCFSEPFHPYAWPVEYQHTLEYDIVALGIFGQTCVVLTKGTPYYASGADSASMSAQKLESPQACVSKRSVVSTEGGVFYASPDGICLAGPQGVALLTLGAYDRDDWQALGPEQSFAAFSEGAYYIWLPSGTILPSAANTGTAVEADTAFNLGVVLVQAIGTPATETDTAFTLPSLTTYIATETDTAFNLALVQISAVQTAVETDEAVTVT